ncbi:methionine adenosyltransferase [Haploplasma axanthum]|uniref:S-adenosylmethionine synthase n=1 Tax=Haploplasma axanthum TaxID=29552 RepID=A0A449BDX6_HAPAX|nr:methionine adenosyltransferase [Haploplasma axanthum]VEU80510.1 S-adenosylmethionine synthase [Haploplasma axanthum]
MNYLFSSESVTKGHPDKVADRISDAILDAVLKEDKNARVACETAIKSDLVLVFGEITTNAKIDYEDIVRKTINEIGYDNDILGFNGNTVEVVIKLSTQSSEIAMGVDRTEELNQGAGDQGLMFGYASNETENYMPLAIDLSHKLALRLTEVREKSIVKDLRPDGKTQVTVEYDENNQPVRIDSIVISTQHDKAHNQETLRKVLVPEVIEKVVPSNLIDDNTKIYINPTGSFILGGPAADSGLTGRKIIVDTYGGYARHGGGAFSGKDPSKVDRSAAYMARYLAKHIVAANLADKCEIQIAYAIGVAKPVSVHIETFGTEKVSKEQIYSIIVNNFDLRPAAIIKKLDLKRPIYTKTSSYGHFGQESNDFTWEQLNDIDIFK